jgi:hypothetical protein
LRTDDWGSFPFHLIGSEVLRDSQAPHSIAGVTELITGQYSGQVVNVINGQNSPRYTNAAPELQFRATAGWQGENLGITLGFNYVHPRQINDTAFPYSLPGPNRGWINSAGVLQSANTAHVGALEVFDLLFNYDVPQGFLGISDSVSSGMQLSMKINNLLDTDPPFDPSTSDGYSVGNPVGRMITIGIRKRF